MSLAAALDALDEAAIARDLSRLVQERSVTGQERGAAVRVVELAGDLGLCATLDVHDLDALRALVAGGEVDNVIVAVPDLAGRLQGSRVAADLFLEEVVANGFSACTYLLASDVEMVAREGYRFSPWDTGFGDLLLRPVPEALRRLPWEPRTVLVIGSGPIVIGQAAEFDYSGVQ
ncbi:MAG: hypothetical protein KY433_10260, partial [Actinobacteria bacterium]|nr:hypothetical protein [Actinomycetota bacterium]